MRGGDNSLYRGGLKAIKWEWEVEKKQRDGIRGKGPAETKRTSNVRMYEIIALEEDIKRATQTNVGERRLDVILCLNVSEEGISS